MKGATIGEPIQLEAVWDKNRKFKRQKAEQEAEIEREDEFERLVVCLRKQ